MYDDFEINPYTKHYGDVEREEQLDMMVARFAALADPTRLRILGLITDGGLTVNQIARRLGAHASTVSRHLKRLREAGILNLRLRDYHHVHRLNEGSLAELWRCLTDRVELAAMAAAIERKPYERRVIAAFTDNDGRVIRIPTEPSRRDIIIGYLVEALGVDMLDSEALFQSALEAMIAPGTDSAEIWRALEVHAGLTREEDSGLYYFEHPPMTPVTRLA